MSFSPIFLSVILVVRNQSNRLKAILTEAETCIAPVVSDYELVVVDNASTDDSVDVLKRLTAEDGLPNLQVYVLTQEVDFDTAAWAGMECSLGDFVGVLDPLLDDITFLPQMLDKAMEGADVVFAANRQHPHRGLAYRTAYVLFNRIYKLCNGVNLATEAPPFRVVSKATVNFILQHPQPSLTYRYLPATGAFSKANLSYSAKPKARPAKRLGESIDHGMRLLVSTSRAPMRLVTSLSLFGAIANVLYSLYIFIVAMFKTTIAPGWVSISLQQSGMFFLLSVVLLVLGEYVLHMASLSNEGPLYHVGQEFTSARLIRRERLNVEAPSRPAQEDIS